MTDGQKTLAIPSKKLLRIILLIIRLSALIYLGFRL